MGVGRAGGERRELRGTEQDRHFIPVAATTLPLAFSPVSEVPGLFSRIVNALTVETHQGSLVSWLWAPGRVDVVSPDTQPCKGTLGTLVIQVTVGLGASLLQTGRLRPHFRLLPGPGLHAEHQPQPDRARSAAE